MPTIRPISPDEAEGFTREVVGRLRAERRPVPKFVLEMGRRPEVLAGRERLRAAVYAGGSSLGRRREELIAFYLAAHGG